MSEKKVNKHMFCMGCMRYLYYERYPLWIAKIIHYIFQCIFCKEKKEYNKIKNKEVINKNEAKIGIIQ